MTWELDDEHRDFQASCRSFVDREVRPRVDAAEASGTFPADLWKPLGAAGLLGLVTPVEHGGDDGDGLAVALLAEELARASGGIAVTALVSAYMAAPHIARYGTPAQQARWLPPLATGEAVASIAVTEPGTGSDVAGVTTTARRTDEGWVLNGRKMYITNAGLADLWIVAARTGDAGRGGVTLFLVETTAPGVSTGAPLAKMGWHSSDTREVVLDDVTVPADAVLGQENRGFYQIMEAFQLERIALAGMGIGHAAECLDLASDYARQREAFGAPLTHLQTVRHKLALMEIELEAARLVTYQAAARLDAGHPEAAKSVARAKYVSAVACNRIVDDAVQLFGGAGFVEESPVARHYRDARILRIGGGTDEIQLEILTRGMAS
ncbi:MULTISPECIES: acyl-CoA dehydrogenase family protein [unclassified Pseudonocardia]|uniref:acyl-CoA dehydrogenase family protein n=1 Tax=unclassified Pseudonocardia TaxID=2619320 RepID=UPI0009693536|nr:MULTISPECIES: acyl-CoA dehydrogenase family protein [unclassified Pseudonocardia]MBN9098974.1 acyl-CoA dehydrogenase family protein [Pseudonocardia sp.]OJY52975.1 MAG: acyl-CoA dehydrogenase [Pseudonocardia sp. 73-21]